VADEVVMAGGGVDLIMTVVLRKIVLSDHAQRGKEVQIPVNRGKADAWLAFLGPPEELIGIEMIAPGIPDEFEEKLPLSGHPAPQGLVR
jgi:hypothetical protein